MKQRVKDTTSSLRQAPLLEVTVGAADLGLQQGRIVLQASWGSGASELGKRDEASRPGPMSLAVGRDGDLFVLDQVNRRVVRFAADGQLQAEIPISAETTEDIALGDDSLWTLVYEPGARPGYRVERYALTGVPMLQHSLPRAIQLVTGLFLAPGSDVWVEQRHEVQTRVVAAGKPNRRLDVLPGRADRAGRGFRLDALRSGTHRARVHGVVPDEGATPLLQVTTRQPIVAIQELESDEQGRLYLGLLVGQGDAVRKVMVVVHDQQARVVELSPHRVTDVFRPVAVGCDGLYQMETTEEGVLVRRWEMGGGR